MYDDEDIPQQPKPIDFSGFRARLEETAKKLPKMTGPEDELAWEIARYFNEPYGQWQSSIRRSVISLDEIRRIFKKQQDGFYTRRDQARVLMAAMFHK